MQENIKETNLPDVPYMVHEEACVKLERVIKRLWVLCIIIFISFIVSNGIWLIYESQWQYVDTTNTNEITQEVQSEGNATIGGISINGESK